MAAAYTFKPGDRVRLTGKSLYGLNLEGKVATVEPAKDVPGFECYVRVLVNDGCCFMVLPEQCTLADEAPTPKFAVGDVVIFTSTCCGGSVEAVVTSNTRPSRRYHYELNRHCKCGNCNWASATELQPAHSSQAAYYGRSDISHLGALASFTLATDKAFMANTTTKAKEAPMSVATRIKRLALSKDDRLLQKYDLQCSEGNWTGEAEAVLMQLLLDDNRDRLVAKARELEAEDKASKK